MAKPDLTALTARLADLPDLNPEPDSVVRRFSGEGVMLQDAQMRKGTSFAPHSHHNEQLVLILEGRLRLDIADPESGAVQSVVLETGDFMRLPPNLPHGGEALEDCRVLDAFSPPRTTFMGEPEPESDGETT